MKETTEKSYIDFFHEKQKEISDILSDMPDGYHTGDLSTDVLAFVTANYLYTTSKLLAKNYHGEDFDNYRETLAKNFYARVEQYIDGIKLLESRKSFNPRPNK